MSAGFGQPPRFSGGLAQNGIVIPLATETTPGLMSAADKAKLDAIAPDWAAYPDDVRVYAVDYDGGSDSSTAYFADAGGITDALITTAMQTAGAAPLKTLEQLLTVLPLNGDGRAVIIAIKNRALGATYLKQDGVTKQRFDFSGYANYWQIRVYATSDFSNSTEDKAKSGAVVSDAGPGASGEWTVNAAGTTFSLAIAGTPNFPAEPAAIGRRVRFLHTTTTAALRDSCSTVLSNTTTAMTLGKALAAAPANTDTFVIEKPGVVFSAVAIYCQSPLVLRGISSESGAAGGFIVSSGDGDMPNLFSNVEICFCSDEGTLGAYIFGGSFVAVGATYHALDGFGFPVASVGAGLRSATAIQFAYMKRLQLDTSGSPAATASTTYLAEILEGECGEGCYYLGGSGKKLSLYACGTTGGSGGVTGDVIVGATPFRWGRPQNRTTLFAATRMDCALLIQDTNVMVDGVTLTNVAAGVNSGAISIAGIGTVVRLSAITGSSGNTGYGVSLSQAKFCKILTAAGVTVTGTLGDVLLGDGGAIATHAGFSLTNVVDSSGNDVMGAAGHIVDSCILVTNKAGAALAVGDQVRSNGTSGQVTSSTGNSATIGDSSTVGVAVTAAADNTAGYITGPGYAYCLFDGAPTIGAICYLSPGTVRKLTTTLVAVAANNNKLRVGRVISTAGGSTGIVRWCPENLAVVSDGAA